MMQEKRTFIEEMEVTGNELVDRIQTMIEEGNARRVTIYSEDGHELISLSLTFGAVAGGLVTLAAPALAALGALAALVSRVKLVVTRETHEEVRPRPQDVFIEDGL